MEPWEASWWVWEAGESVSRVLEGRRFERRIVDKEKDKKGKETIQLQPWAEAPSSDPWVPPARTGVLTAHPDTPSQGLSQC